MSGCVKKFPFDLRAELVEVLQPLKKDPRGIGTKKLSGSKSLYRIRIGPGGNYRALYQIHNDRLIVVVVSVADRKGS